MGTALLIRLPVQGPQQESDSTSRTEVVSRFFEDIPVDFFWQTKGLGGYGFPLRAQEQKSIDDLWTMSAQSVTLLRYLRGGAAQPAACTPSRRSCSSRTWKLSALYLSLAWWLHTSLVSRTALKLHTSQTLHCTLTDKPLIAAQRLAYNLYKFLHAKPQTLAKTAKARNADLRAEAGALAPSWMAWTQVPSRPCLSQYGRSR